MALADLSVSKTANTLTPMVGDVITFTLTLTNAGPASASNIQVQDRLPDGFTYLAHMGDGSYDPASGVWTITSLGAGDTAALRIRARVNESGHYTNVAEITAATPGDPDSTPNNHDPHEDDWASVTLSPRHPARVGGMAWLDLDADGVRSPGEPPLPHVQVHLYASSDCSGTPLMVGETAGGTGAYTFDHLAPGTYSLSFAPLAGMHYAPANQGSDDTADSDVDPHTGCTGPVVLEDGADDSTWSAGYYGEGTIGGMSWVDHNGNGVRDGDETDGLPHVPIAITGVDVWGYTHTYSVTTSITGTYGVDRLVPGTYTVTAPARSSGFVLTSSSPLTFTLDAGHMAVSDADFGYIAPTAVLVTNVYVAATEQGVQLTWRVRADSGPALRFRVWRAGVGAAWQPASGWLAPARQVGSEWAYAFTDASVQVAGTYLYRLEDEGGQWYGPWLVHWPGRATGEQMSGGWRSYVPFLPHRSR